MGLTDVIAIAVGNSRATALRADGSLWWWGSGVSSGSSTVPVEEAVVEGAVAISAGHNYDCVLVAGGSAWCWGTNACHELGDGTTTNSSVPVQVFGLTDAVAIRGATDVCTCALRASNSVVCWGECPCW
jgi:alpha-tubulin suppressor-like RCC1 family protein